MNVCSTPDSDQEWFRAGGDADQRCFEAPQCDAEIRKARAETSRAAMAKAAEMASV